MMIYKTPIAWGTALFVFLAAGTAYASHPGASIDAKRIGRVSAADATFTDMKVSSIADGQCVQSSSGKLVASGSSCGGASAGDVTSVGSCLSGACAAATTTDATFGNIQATQIGKVSSGDATFATIRATKIDATKIGTVSAADASFSAMAVDTNVLYVDPNTNRVGIGTTTPLAQLEIRDSSGAPAQPLSYGTTGAGANSLLLVNDVGNISLIVSGGAGQFIPGTQSGDGGIRFSSGKSFFFGHASAANRFKLTSAGVVTIPTLAAASNYEFVCVDGSGMLFNSALACENV